LPFALKSVALFALLTFTGCATTPTPKVALTGDILVDGPKMAAEGPARDRVLWQYRTAAAAMRQGKFDVAKPLLDDALLTLQGNFGPDAEARKSRRLFSRESRKTFIGEPYERSLAYFYRGVLYWRDGELDNARACFRSAQFEDSDTADKAYAGDWVLPDYLEALATTKLGGDGSDALKRAQANVKNASLPPLDPTVNTLFIVEFGPGPTKYASGNYGEQLRFRIAASPVKSSLLQINSLNIPIAPVDDVNYQATTRGGRVMDHILANQAVFKSATDSFGDAAIVSGAILAGAGQGRRNSSEEVGLGLLAAGLVSKLVSSAASPEADVRMWDNLPQLISFAQLTLPVGTHTATIQFVGSDGKPVEKLTKTVTFTLPATGPDQVIFISDTSTTPQAQ
jgi:tetratricopeptide (TPR) repeat protein